MLLTLLKAACLALYALALAGFAGLLPNGLAIVLQMLAAVFLIVHALELVVAFKHVRRYRGSLAGSVLQTLLFGVLHWVPIARAQAPAK